MSSQVSRPVLIALVATVLFGAVWFVALRPKSDNASTAAATPAAAAAAATPAAASSGPNAPGVTGLKHDIAKAQGAVATSQQSAQQLQGQSGAASSSAAAPAAASPGTAAAPATKPSATAATPAPTATSKPGAAASSGTVANGAKSPAAAAVAPGHAKLTTPQRVQAALAKHKILVFLFYNPRGEDDRAMHSQLRHVARHHGQVVVLSAPISQLEQYKMITTKVEIDGTPSLLFFDRTGRVAALRGFADAAEVRQRVIDVLRDGVKG